MRVGMGYDVHKLVEDRKLILGGVEIPYEKGLLGHSDADVLLHAVMDALLGAAALGDIGKHFPDTDPAYEGASSIKLLEEVGKVIEKGGVGVTISSQSGWRMPQLTAEQDAQLATTPTEELLSLEILQPENIRDTLHAYQLAKRCNEKRVMAQSVEWGKRGARINDIAPGIIVTPLAVDEFNGPRGDFYKNMFAKCPAGRPGTADEVANVAELLMSDRGAFITGSTFLVDGGATASYYYGPLKPEM